AMAGPLAILYFMSSEPRLPVMRASLIAFFPFASLLTLPATYAAGLLNTEALILAAAGIPVMAAGSWAGAWAFLRFGHSTYRPAATAALALTALASIGKGIAELLH
ncbi:MAG TPA: hypothetical protein VGC80_07880, partial [Acetobacteraceae bacterium]